MSTNTPSRDSEVLLGALAVTASAATRKLRTGGELR